MSTVSMVDLVLGHYADRHAEPTRNLAELMNAIPKDCAPWVRETLDECAALYRARHGIAATELDAAVADHRAWESMFNATCEAPPQRGGTAAGLN